MKKYISVILLIFNFCSTSNAQVPGFIGKKFVVSGGVLFFPAHNCTYNNRQNLRFSTGIADVIFGDANFFPIYGLNLTKTLTVDYTLSRNVTIGMSVQNMRSSDYISVANTDVNGHVYYTNDAIRYVYGNSIGANLKIFNENRGAIAPIGNFKKLGLSILLARSFDSLDNILKTTPTKNHFATFTYGFGKTTIFQKNFTFTYGMDFTIMLDTNIGSLDGHNDTRRYSDASFYRLRKMQFFNAYTTIGYIF